MKLFENVWTVKGTSYVREYDTVKQKSIMTATPHKAEYYLFDQLGKYRSFFGDKNLRRVEGSAYKNPDAYGPRQADYVAIREMHFGKNTYNKNPGTFYLDIETSVGTQPGSEGFPQPEQALEPIVLIQFYDTTSKKGYVIGREAWKYQSDYDYSEYDLEVEYIQCDSEEELIRTYLDLFKKLDPLIIYAWNGNVFDFPYIHNRLKNLRMSVNNMSNYGKANLKTRKLDNGMVMHTLESTGHFYIDLMEVYKKFVFDTVPSHGLDYIGEKETKLRKVNHDNYLKFDDFRIGKYVILGNETEEITSTKLYKIAKLLEDNPDHPKADQMKTYIKEKSHSDFIHYGVMDFVILKGIDDKRAFTSVMLSMAELMGIKLSDTMSTLKPWDTYISNTILKQGLITPPKSDIEPYGVVGGYVAPPRTGKHKWVLSSDIASMYPSNMRAYNMSPETFIQKKDRPKELQAFIDKYLYDQDEERVFELLKNEQFKNSVIDIIKKYNVSLSYNGAVFSRVSEGFIPKLVGDIYNTRKAHKKQQFVHEQAAIAAKLDGNVELYHKESKLEILENVSQMTQKILINSLYGGLAARHFSLFNEDLAAGITMNGRMFIITMSEYIEDKLQSLMPRSTPYRIYNDTDSVYFSIEPFIEKYVGDKDLETQIEFADKFYKKVVDPAVQASIEYFAEITNAFNPSVIASDREVISDSSIFVAKKKYAMRVRDNEGTRYPSDDPYIKVTGLEVQQGGTAPFSKKNLKNAVKVILDKDNSAIKDWFQETRDTFMDSHIADKAKTTGVSKLSDPKWGKVIEGRKVSIPFGSKTCIASNKYIKENDLMEQFPLIEPGTKVKVLYLNKPNPMNAEAFAFTDPRFAQMMEDYVDYDTTFQKYFTKPLENMTKVLNIDVTSNLQELDEW